MAAPSVRFSLSSSPASSGWVTGVDGWGEANTYMRLAGWLVCSQRGGMHELVEVVALAKRFVPLGEGLVSYLW